MRLYSIMKDFLTMKEYLPMEYFMKRYDVSRRTIQNDLSYLIQISSRNGYQLHMRRGNGYLLEVINDRLLDEFMKSLEHETMFDMKDRVKNMMAYLTLQESYVSMDRMAEQFQISRTSVKKDLQEVEKQLQVHQLQLEKKSHYGIRIRGDTQHIRKLMCELYFDGNTFITQELEKEEASFSRIHEVLVHSIEREHLNINYNELKNVMVWLKVTLYLAQIQKRNDIIQTRVRMHVNGSEHRSYRPSKAYSPTAYRKRPVSSFLRCCGSISGRWCLPAPSV
ncbi:MAG: BglG family transcription antiterminator [Clostridium sp.]